MDILKEHRDLDLAMSQLQDFVDGLNLSEVNKIYLDNHIKILSEQIKILAYKLEIVNSELQSILIRIDD